MANFIATEQPHIATVMYGGNRYDARVRITWDGLEYVGRMWFANETDADDRTPDRSALPGRTPDDVIALARQLTSEELERRLSRALAEKRRYIDLRQVTDVIIEKIRYMNQVAISMHAGLLDHDGAAGEIELTEKQLHELVDTLRNHAGLAR